MALSEVWGKGGDGGVELAKEVIRLCDAPNDFTFAYDLDLSIEEKIKAIVTKIYGGKDVAFTANAQKQIRQMNALGFDKLPICMAKTQYSLTDDPTKLGAPEGFAVTVRNIKVSAGAGFLVGADRRYYDHARPAEGPGGRAHRRGRERQDLRPVLMPGFLLE